MSARVCCSEVVVHFLKGIPLDPEDMGLIFKSSSIAFLLGTLGLSLARLIPVDEGQGLEAQRYKRQLPQTTKGENVEPNQELLQGPRQSRQVETRGPVKRQNFQNFQNTRWELGYDASDILTPPELLPSETQYRTMNIYRRHPSSVIDNSPVIWGTPKKGAVVSRPGRSSKEGAVGVTTVYYASKDSKKRQADREEEEEEDDDESEEGEEDGSSEDAGYTEQGHSFHQVPASIYSFFGTDADGNFNWGDRRSPSSPQ